MPQPDGVKIVKEPNKAKKSAVKKALVAIEQPVDTTTGMPLTGGFPIIGIGASAGGLAAFENFFSGMPCDVDPNMAFILVQHLAPDHKSILTDLVRRYTRMQVYEVKDGMNVRINCTYIIPPNYDMALLNGKLQLLAPTAKRGLRLPVDFFFRSLAFDQDERSIAIVLSGSGSDGTLGVKAIKDAGGFVIAQSPESTEYESMPRNAINTGLVDLELLPRDMATALISYVKRGMGSDRWKNLSPKPIIANEFQKIFVLLRSATGHDFSQYKVNTVHRRIERRMAVNKIETIADYVTFLQNNHAEAEALFRDLLIGVTRFFRDTEAFSCLRKIVIEKLILNRPRGDIIRIWAPACSTGEEAYSIAILIQEAMTSFKTNFIVQIFATDIDERAIEVARNGLYSSTVANDLTPERLSLFFTKDQNGENYRIKKNIRDMLIFSVQNVIKDPPFSALDFISCRNLLIYMNSELQRKVIPLFHYSLNRHGLLFLGSSEGINEFSDLFATLERSAKIFQRKEDIHGRHRLAFSRLLGQSPYRIKLEDKSVSAYSPPTKPSLRQLTEQTLLLHMGSAGVLVNERGDILYLHGRTGQYLEPTPGEAAINNILKMARPGLKFELTTALYKATKQRHIVEVSGVQVKTNGHHSATQVTVRPILENVVTPNEAPLFLVIFDATQPDTLPLQPESVEQADLLKENDQQGHIAILMDQLRTKEEYLQASNEELETSNEELKSTNEEMQSVNEELQSTNEELETSREELQSVNEELSTVNSELQNKLMDLSRLNNDMNNLLAGTGIGTIFVDHELRIMRFTPMATAIINLIPSDEGRPVAHIASNLLHYDKLVSDIQSVLKTLIPSSVEVLTQSNKWYLMRILPYRTLANVIEGAVLTFVDVTEIRTVREQLSRANKLQPLVNMVLDSHDAITVTNIAGRLTAWNPAASSIYGWEEAEAKASNFDPRIPDNLKHELLANLKDQVLLPTNEPYLTQRYTKAGELLTVWMIPTALFGESGEVYAIANIERPVPKDINENANS
jgi:two-component system CheB/CheR fusion protein